MPKQVFIVTGGAGFVGSNLAAALTKRYPGAGLCVVDDFRSGAFANLVSACERAGVGAFRGEVIAKPVADIAWEELVKAAKPTAVFHLAAITDTTVMDEAVMIRENTGGFREMMRACAAAGVPLVYASSAATYGTPAQTAARKAFPLAAAGKPNNVYGFSKWLMECEHACIAGELKNPHIVGLRYFNVFGPGEARKGKMASMALQLATQMLNGKRPRLFKGGEQARDQVYVDDVVDCTIAAAGLEKGAACRPGVYNLGSGVATTFNQVVASLREELGISERDLPTEYFDMPASIRAFYQDFTLADMSETNAGLGWRPKWKPPDAIRAYARWLKEQAPATPR